MYTATFLEEEVPSHCLLLESNIFNIAKGEGGRRTRLGAEKPSGFFCSQSSKARGMTGNMQMEWPNFKGKAVKKHLKLCKDIREPPHISYERLLAMQPWW